MAAHVLHVLIVALLSLSFSADGMRLDRSRRASRSNQTNAASCQSWCQSDRDSGKNQGRHCAPGDMAHLCGGCSFCGGGACQNWCQSDRDGGKNQGRHCAPGDMANLCGGCSFCSGGSSPTPAPTPSTWSCPSTGLQVKVLTYNLFWWNLFGQRRGNGGSAGRLISGASNPAFDFIGFQECDNVGWPMGDAGLSNSHGTLNGGHALAIAYHKSWTLLSGGTRDVGEDRHDQYYGKRGVHWGRFRRGAVTTFVMNFHGPLPVGTGGAYGGTATANNILNVVRESAQPSDAIIFVGDFNQPAHASMIKALDGSLNRLYTGRSFGGVDHVYSSCGQDRVASKRNLGTGGSDHDALEITIRM